MAVATWVIKMLKFPLAPKRNSMTKTEIQGLIMGSRETEVGCRKGSRVRSGKREVGRPETGDGRREPEVGSPVSDVRRLETEESVG